MLRLFKQTNCLLSFFLYSDSFFPIILYISFLSFTNVVSEDAGTEDAYLDLASYLNTIMLL
jgi:hypothetical protein